MHLSFTNTKELISKETGISIKDVGKVFSTLSDIINERLKATGDRLTIKNIITIEIKDMNRNYGANLKQPFNKKNKSKTVRIIKSRNLKKGLE